MQNHITNSLEICGKVSAPVSPAHSIYGENFYEFMIEVPRLSGNIDTLPVTLPGRAMTHSLELGDYICVKGQIRSYNKFIDGKGRLELRVFLHSFEKCAEGTARNELKLVGFICRQPVFRVTPFGREITDMMLAVNRTYNKSDYIPAIAWGKTARMARELNVWDCVNALGRMQSREYDKLLPDGRRERRTAYEVSLMRLEKCIRDNYEE